MPTDDFNSRFLQYGTSQKQGYYDFDFDFDADNYTPEQRAADEQVIKASGESEQNMAYPVQRPEPVKYQLEEFDEEAARAEVDRDYQDAFDTIRAEHEAAIARANAQQDAPKYCKKRERTGRLFAGLADAAGAIAQSYAAYHGANVGKIDSAQKRVSGRMDKLRATDARNAKDLTYQLGRIEAAGIQKTGELAKAKAASLAAKRSAVDKRNEQTKKREIANNLTLQRDYQRHLYQSYLAYFRQKGVEEAQAQRLAAAMMRTQYVQSQQNERNEKSIESRQSEGNKNRQNRIEVQSMRGSGAPKGSSNSDSKNTGSDNSGKPKSKKRKK